MLLQIQAFLDCFLDIASKSETALSDFSLNDFYPEPSSESFNYPQKRDYEVIMFSLEDSA